MSKIVSFGEILLRLKSAGFERLFQTQNLEGTFGGSEANSLILLSRLGEETSFVTAVPDNAIGDAVVSDLRKQGVNVTDVVKREGRLGIYFLEAGSCQRPSTVVYDRANSCIAEADETVYDWNRIFEGSEWFHTSGITPALSQKACDSTLSGMKAAAENGLTVSMDINYRSKLWKYGVQPQEVLKKMVSLSNVLIANEEHVRLCLEITVDGYDVTKEGLPDEYFEKLCKAVKEKYPSLKQIALTRRRTYSSDCNDVSAVLLDCESGKFYVSEKYHIEHIIDRVGAGDAFTGALIYGLKNLKEKQEAIEFANAASCLKHTIPGDIAYLSKSDIDALVKNKAGGRIQR